MSEIGYIKIPRSLLFDPLWNSLSLLEQHIFLVILANTCYRPQKYNDHGVILDLEPGQFCTTYRELADLCKKKTTKDHVDRAIKKFALYHFLRQEVRHIKSVLTICHKDTYDLIVNSNETGFATTLRQDCDRIATEKNKDKKDKKDNKIKQKPTPSANAASLLDFFNDSLQKNIPEVAEPCKAQTAFHFDVLLKSYSPDEIRNVITFSHQGWWAKVVHAPTNLKNHFTKILAAMRREQNPLTGKINGNTQKPLGQDYRPEENPKFKLRDPFETLGIKGN